MGEKKNAYKMLVVKPERRRPFERSRHRCEGSIKIEVKEI
jgi:hypothetical protein